MNIQINSLTNANIYIDGVGLLGRAEEIEIANPKHKMIDYKGLGDRRKFRPPSAASFAGLVQSGFSVQELSEMDFAELSYWLDAMTDYERMRVERGGGDES